MNKPNEFEAAVLERLTCHEPKLQEKLSALRVVSRTYTPCGCYTDFLSADATPGYDRYLDWQPIYVPGVRGCMCAVLFCQADTPLFLELVTLGGESWDGTYEGFVVGDEHRGVIVAPQA